MRNLFFIFAVVANSFASAQSLFGPLYDTSTFTGGCMNQSDSSYVAFIGGINVEVTAPIRSTNVFYYQGEIVAQLQGDFEITSDYSNQAVIISGNMPNDSIITCAIAKVTGDSLVCFRIYHAHDLTMKAQYPAATELPTRSGCRLNGHDMALSESGYSALTYDYLETTSRYGDSVGQFMNVALQESVISDSTRHRVAEISWIDVFPDSVWNIKRSVQPGPNEEIPLSRRDPFHINSIEFMHDSLILVSARSLGIFVYNWQTSHLKSFIPEDSDGIILQHNVRLVGGDTISVFSDGDQITSPQGLLVNIATGQVISSYYPFDTNPLRSYALGSYEYQPKCNVLCTGVQNNPQMPFGFSNNTSSVRAIDTNGDTLFDWETRVSSFSARLVKRDVWTNQINVAHYNSGLMVSAYHPATNQPAVWFGKRSGEWQKIGFSDTLSSRNFLGCDSLLYLVATSDTSGWYFISPKIATPEATTIPTVSDPEFQIYPNPSKGWLYVHAPTVSPYSIYSIQGKLLESGTLSVGFNELDAAYLPSGFYILKTKLGNQRFAKIQ